MTLEARKIRLVEAILAVESERDLLAWERNAPSLPSAARVLRDHENGNTEGQEEKSRKSLDLSRFTGIKSKVDVGASRQKRPIEKYDAAKFAASMETLTWKESAEELAASLKALG